MKNELKCYRCGTKIDIDRKKLSDTVTCPHCNGKMTLDKKTNRWVKVFRVLFIILGSFILLLTISRVTSSTTVLILATVGLALLVSLVADTASLWLAYITVGLRYEHIETDKEARDKKKNKK